MDFNSVSNYVVIAISLMEVLLAIYILTRHPASLVKNVLGLMTLSAALWLFSGGYGALIGDLNGVLFWWKVTFLGATGIAAFFLLFSWAFPFQREKIKGVHYVIVILPIVFFGFLLFLTDSLVKGLDTSGKLPMLTFGISHKLFAAYFIGYWLWAIINLFKKYKASDGLHRWQLKILLWGTVISSVIGITTNLIFALAGIAYKNFDWSIIGYIASAIWLGVVSYVIWGRR